jgi:hypothetical protein
MSLQPPILDTMILQAFAFGHPHGCDFLLQALGTKTARFPAEVYNLDEDREDLAEGDPSLSEFARGIRWARGQVDSLPPSRARRYERWLLNLRQLATHINAGHLAVDPLTVAELSSREAISRQFGIGRGESACLVLAQRSNGTAVFVSSDDKACQAAESLSVQYLTLPELLKDWVHRHKPERALLDELLKGMADARFTLGAEEKSALLSAYAVEGS